MWTTDDMWTNEDIWANDDMSMHIPLPWPRSLTPRAHPFGRCIAEFLVEVRVQAGMTQSELAGAIDTTQPAIAKLETARHLPSLGMLVRIAEVTKIPIALKADFPRPPRFPDVVPLWPPPDTQARGRWPLY